MKELKKISKRKFLKTNIKEMQEIYFIQKRGNDLLILSVLDRFHHMIVFFSEKVCFDPRKDVHFDPADLSYNIVKDLRKKCYMQNETDDVVLIEIDPDPKAEYYKYCRKTNKRRVPIYTLDCDGFHMGMCDIFDQIDRPFILVIEK